MQMIKQRFKRTNSKYLATSILKNSGPELHIWFLINSVKARWVRWICWHIVCKSKGPSLQQALSKWPSNLARNLCDKEFCRNRASNHAKYVLQPWRWLFFIASITSQRLLAWASTTAVLTLKNWVAWSTCYPSWSISVAGYQASFLQWTSMRSGVGNNSFGEPSYLGLRPVHARASYLALSKYQGCGCWYRWQMRGGCWR